MTDQMNYPEQDMDGGHFQPAQPEMTPAEQEQYQAQYTAAQAAAEYAQAYVEKYGLVDPALIEAIHDSHYAYIMNNLARRFFTPAVVINHNRPDEYTLRGRPVEVPDGIVALDYPNQIDIQLDSEYLTSVTVYKGYGNDFAAKINWCACGSKDAEYADRFAKAMTFAVRVCEDINRLKEEDYFANHDFSAAPRDA